MLPIGGMDFSSGKRIIAAIGGMLPAIEDKIRVCLGTADGDALTGMRYG